MKKRNATIWLVLVFLVVTGSTRANFILYGNKQLTVSSDHSSGYLHDTSRAFIPNWSVGSLYSYDSSTTNISGGGVRFLDSGNNSTVNISGGSVGSLKSDDNSAVNISGGGVSILYFHDNSTVNISGGSIDLLCSNGHSVVNISGGSVGSLKSGDNSTTTFYGRNFYYGRGLTIDGFRVRGTGILSGEWLDGTRWTVNIRRNASKATILTISKPSTN